MKIIRLSDTRMLIQFSTRKEQTLSMFRLSEFSEGKEGIKGRHFTPDEFIDRYSDEKGDLNYFSFWDGFNIPIREINNFLHKFSKSEISKREKKIIKAVRFMPITGTLITCEQGDENTLKHETAHAKFADNEEYRNEVLDVVHSIDFLIKKEFKNGLLKNGYSEEVIPDEIHAYILAYDQEDMDELEIKVQFSDIEKYHNKLSSIYDNYA
jgi:hypothetical protein